ncbi:hypothetical protein NG791_03745 [Laspinema sp. D1]|uniref:hypothetical protein n=1 Tax=Laspinema palackyanum TaxID=3231601 RepID=UPI00348B25E4|nr:hypothetical protein [Laspinema sp. D2b]
MTWLKRVMDSWRRSPPGGPHPNPPLAKGRGPEVTGEVAEARHGLIGRCDRHSEDPTLTLPLPRGGDRISLL